MKFEVGEIVITPAASAALEANGYSLRELLRRHQAGDWGDVSDQVRAVNERGLAENFNLQSSYTLDNCHRLIVVTRRDRELTMIHLETIHAGTRAG